MLALCIGTALVFPLVAVLLKSRVNIDTSDLRPRGNDRSGVQHRARFFMFDLDELYDTPSAVRQFLE